jgi:hypothetical protein
MRKQAPHQFVIAVFLAVLAGPPVVQAVVEANRREWPSVLSVFSQAPTPGNLRAFERSVQDSSVAVISLRPLVQAIEFFALGDAGEKALVGRDDWLFYAPGVGYITQRRRPSDSTVKEAVSAIMRMRDDLEARGIRLIVVPAPNKESVYPDQLSRLASPPTQAISAETRDLLSQCRAAGVEVLDLFAAYRAERKRSGDPLYLRQDSHWTPRGMQAAAVATAARIIERGWLSPGPIRFQVRPIQIEEHGDLVKMIQSPQIESFLRPQSIRVDQIIRDDTGALFRDEAAPEVLVLGDSFLRIYQHDAPGSAGFVAHLAKALGRKVGSIISDGGSSTLVRQRLFHRPQLLTHAKVVVWEFVERDIRLGMEGWQIVPLPPAEPPVSRVRSE